MRIGHGYDAHQLGFGRPLVLGGVLLEFERGLIGHSDGDVVLHALIDALLGAAALGDIGAHFPSTDERWRGANSVSLVEHVAGLLRMSGFQIGNADITLVAQSPRLAPHIAAMRRSIAAALGCSIDAVSVKAKTTDGMGFEGRGEGISATAVVLLT